GWAAGCRQPVPRSASGGRRVAEQDRWGAAVRAGGRRGARDATGPELTGPRPRVRSDVPLPRSDVPWRGLAEPGPRTDAPWHRADVAEPRRNGRRWARKNSGHERTA